MSIVVKRNSLTQEQAQSIAQHLQFVPEKPFVPGKKFQSNKVEDAIQIYRKIGDDIYLPYTFAKKFLQVSAPSRPEVNLPFKGTLRPNQVPKAEEALTQLKEHGTTTLQLDTAYGKTYISAYLASQLGRLTLVLHNMQVLHGQWIKTFEAATDCFIWDAYKKIPPQVSVIVCSAGTIHHIPKEILAQVGTLILDESHKLCISSGIAAILQVTPEFIIASSYTYERSDKSHMFMDAVMGLHRVHGRLDINITAVACKTKFTYDIPKNAQGTDWSALVNNICADQERNKFICDLVQLNLHRKIMLLTPRVEHAKHLCEMLVERGINADYITSKKAKYHTGNVLVGSTAKINTGFDEKNYCADFNGVPSNMLINVGSNKQESLIVQTVGRLKRATNAILVDIVDDIEIVKRHARARKKIYEQEGYAICEMEGLFVVPEHQE